MSSFDPSMRPMLETFIFEVTTILEQLDEIMIQAEKNKALTGDEINEIFRFMHTIKGSSSMMGVNSVATLAHAVEDAFFILREDPSKLSLVNEVIFDSIFQSSDYFKSELEMIQTTEQFSDDKPEELIALLKEQVAIMKAEAAPAPKAEAPAPNNAPIPDVADAATPAENDEQIAKFVPDEDMNCVLVRFNDDCQMENIRAFMLITQLKDWCEDMTTVPANPENDSELCEVIIRDGLLINFHPTTKVQDVYSIIESSANVKSYEIIEYDGIDHVAVQQESEPIADIVVNDDPTAPAVAQANAPVAANKPATQSLISINQSKLDLLMDLVGELVTTESMVSSNPDLKGLKLENFNKATRELRKLTGDLQDAVMSMRMMPLSGVFQKMNRIVRDMSKKLNRKVELVTIGGETEMDKNVNDAITDPFIHMVRNSVDHAIESPEDRIALGKPETGTVTIAAQTVGGEIVITITDDGRGLMKDKILAKAQKNGILTKPENEYTDKEIFAMIMLPGFSTKDKVTEISGRGVGMDVVKKNIEKIGGSISIESAVNVGTTFTIKIPLTLVIVNGMEVSVGNTIFILPITSITQTFRLDKNEVIENTDKTEMIMIRGECLPVIRLNQFYDMPSKTSDLQEGIFIQVENADSGACLFVDELLGEQQVVLKPFPPYFGSYDIKRFGVSGCAILGDGSISLVLDSTTLMNCYKSEN